MRVLALVLLSALGAASARTRQTAEQQAETLKKLVDKMTKGEREGKALGYYSYYRPLDYQTLPPGYFYPPQTKDFGNGIFPEEWLSRTEPFKRKNTQQMLDSPVYYVRLPPSPYVFVPGVGYVSRPPSLTEPEVLNAIDNIPEKDPELVQSPFIHVPIDFVSNGKPTGVYQLPNEALPTKPSSVLNLNKGPYVFNGKPVDIYILRNSYNSMYADALTHFYP